MLEHGGNYGQPMTNTEAQKLKPHLDFNQAGCFFQRTKFIIITMESLRNTLSRTHPRTPKRADTVLRNCCPVLGHNCCTNIPISLSAELQHSGAKQGIPECLQTYPKPLREKRKVWLHGLCHFRGEPNHVWWTQLYFQQFPIREVTSDLLRDRCYFSALGHLRSIFLSKSQRPRGPLHS